MYEPLYNMSPQHTGQPMQVQQMPPWQAGPAGTPTLSFGLGRAPAIFTNNPRIEQILIRLNTELRQGTTSPHLFANADMVRERIAGFQADYSTPGSDARVQDWIRNYGNNPAIWAVLVYIAQIYMLVKYRLNAEHPVSIQRAADYAIWVLVTEHGVARNIPAPSRAEYLTSLRSLQFFWGHFGGLITLSVFPPEWDAQNAAMRQSEAMRAYATLDAPQQPQFSQPGYQPQPQGYPQQGYMPQGQGNGQPYMLGVETRSRCDQMGIPGLETYLEPTAHTPAHQAVTVTSNATVTPNQQPSDMGSFIHFSQIDKTPVPPHPPIVAKRVKEDKPDKPKVELAPRPKSREFVNKRKP